MPDDCHGPASGLNGGDHDAKQPSPKLWTVVDRILGGKPRWEPPARPADGGPEHRDQLNLDDDGSQVVSTRSDSHYIFQLTGGEYSVVRTVDDENHAPADEGNPLRRDLR